MDSQCHDSVNTGEERPTRTALVWRADSCRPRRGRPRLEPPSVPSGGRGCVRANHVPYRLRPPWLLSRARGPIISSGHTAGARLATGPVKCAPFSSHLSLLYASSAAPPGKEINWEASSCESLPRPVLNGSNHQSAATYYSQHKQVQREFPSEITRTKFDAFRRIPGPPFYDCTLAPFKYRQDFTFPHG